MKACKYCGLNPSEMQSDSQAKWEASFTRKHKGICNACWNEGVRWKKGKLTEVV